LNRERLNRNQCKLSGSRVNLIRSDLLHFPVRRFSKTRNYGILNFSSSVEYTCSALLPDGETFNTESVRMQGKQTNVSLQTAGFDLNFACF